MVGSLPLTFSLSSSQLRLISALGMGVLVGTSLIVIIPEGVETLYSSTTPVSHQHRRGEIAARGAHVRWEHSPGSLILPRDEANEAAIAAVAGSGNAEPMFTTYNNEGETQSDNDKRTEEDNEDDSKADDGKDDDGKDDDGKDDGKEDDREEDDGKEEGNEKKQRSPHAWIGVGLVSGFLLMYLVDQLPQFAAPSSNQQQRTYHISLDNLSSGLERGPSPSRAGFLGLNAGQSSRSRGFATTTGLVIHAAADGIALGASSSNTGLSFIIFVAIMVHKAPASFGLTTVLLRQGLSTRAARAHLLVFSLAAPVGAFLTWLVAHTVLAGHVGDEQGTRWRTGMLLLFSAGTFL